MKAQFTVETRLGMETIVSSAGRLFPFGPGYHLPFSQKHRESYSTQDAETVCSLANGLKTYTKEIDSPKYIPHNLPVILRANLGEDFPRYRVYGSMHTAAASWEIVDRDAYNSKGNPCSRSMFKNKKDWSLSDIRSFVEYLNSR